MIVVLLGPPGSGKGSHSDKICPKYGLFPISTGDILRELINVNDTVAKNISVPENISQMMGTGELFPDKIVNNLVVEAINNNIYKPNYKGLLFDGYPRTVSQASFLKNTLSKINKKVNCVLVFNIPDSMIISRISARRVDKKTGKVYNLISMPPPSEVMENLFQRIDDTEEVVKNRLNIYKKQTEPLIEYYSKENIIQNINASKDFEITQKNIDNALENIRLLKD